MKANTKILLTKILSNENIEKFLDGKIYMNTDTYFSNLNVNDYVRFDRDEGVDEIWQAKRMMIKPDAGKWVSIGGLINPIRVQYRNREKLNIFCMHMKVKSKSYTFDTRNTQFGDTAIVIRDAREFVSRFRKAAEKVGRDIHHGPISYVDSTTYHGEFGPFRKCERFKYQSEFRFILHNGDGFPLVLDIGDLRDICFVTPSSEIFNIQPNTQR